jgi:hypothetical protein
VRDLIVCGLGGAESIHDRSCCATMCSNAKMAAVDSLPSYSPAEEVVVDLTITHISPIAALLAGILILIFPQSLNYVVALYLIVVGLIGLNDIYHFIK